MGNGKLSIFNDAEIPSVIYSTFKSLGFDSFTIRINNRKVLNGFFDELGINDKVGVLRAIDKLEKVGQETVVKELENLGINEGSIERMIRFIKIEGSNSEIIRSLKSLNISNEVFNKGLVELEQVVHYIKAFSVPEENYAIDLKIARGLDYYTGTVYETILNDYPQIGSVCSGGRYDDLAEYYTNQKLPGVGISIGLTRLFYQLREANIIQPEAATLSKVLVIPIDDNYEYCINVASELRNNGIISEVYVEDTKTAKKLTYANKLGIPYVILIGSEEVRSNLLTFKNMVNGEQDSLSISQIIERIN